MSCDVTTTQLDSVHDFAPLGLKRAVTPLFVLAASTRPTRRHGDLLFRAAIYLPQFVTAAEPLVLAGIAVIMMGTAIGAAWAPIGRMLTLNPQHLLRSE